VGHLLLLAAPHRMDTDWDRIVLLYEALGRLAPSPVVDLNRAVAISMADGPAPALSRLEALADELRLGALPHAVVDLHGLVDVAKERLSAYEHGAIA